MEVFLVYRANMVPSVITGIIHPDIVGVYTNINEANAIADPDDKMFVVPLTLNVGPGEIVFAITGEEAQQLLAPEANMEVLHPTHLTDVLVEALHPHHIGERYRERGADFYRTFYHVMEEVWRSLHLRRT